MHCWWHLELYCSVFTQQRSSFSISQDERAGAVTQNPSCDDWSAKCEGAPGWKCKCAC